MTQVYDNAGDVETRKPCATGVRLLFLMAQHKEWFLRARELAYPWNDGNNWCGGNARLSNMYEDFVVRNQVWFWWTEADAMFKSGWGAE